MLAENLTFPLPGGTDKLQNIASISAVDHYNYLIVFKGMIALSGSQYT